MARRRKSSTQSAPDKATDGPAKGDVGLAARVAALESTCDDMLQRIGAIQAQLDHLAAKFGGR